MLRLCYVYFQHILHVQIQIVTGTNATCKVQVETLLLSANWVWLRNAPWKAFHRHRVRVILLQRFGPFTSSYIGIKDISSHDLYTWLLLIFCDNSQMPVILHYYLIYSLLFKAHNWFPKSMDDVYLYKTWRGFHRLPPQQRDTGVGEDCWSRNFSRPMGDLLLWCVDWKCSRLVKKDRRFCR